jgi:hypothetical protein
MVPEREPVTYAPAEMAHRTYDTLYGMYRELGAGNGTVAEAMRRLRTIH